MDSGAVSGGVLAAAELQVEGVLTDASNLTARVLLVDEAGLPTGERALYKPIRGEAPLRDFPSRTLGRREVAAYLISSVGGWGLIPLTVLRDGPLGPGSVQRWVDWESTGRGPGAGLLEAFPSGEVPSEWLPLVQGEDAGGGAVTVCHADAADLASLAVLDVVLNNADRKGAHLVRDGDGHLWGFDHGLTLHVEDKLRTVLWGWAGQALPREDLARLERLQGELTSGGDLAARLTESVALDLPTGGPEPLISDAELTALRARVDALLSEPVFPDLPTDRYPLPWPLW